LFLELSLILFLILKCHPERSEGPPYGADHYCRIRSPIVTHPDAEVPYLRVPYPSAVLWRRVG